MFTIIQATPADANAAMKPPNNLKHPYIFAYPFQLDVPGAAATAAIFRLEVVTSRSTGTKLWMRQVVMFDLTGVGL